MIYGEPIKIHKIVTDSLSRTISVFWDEEHRLECERNLVFARLMGNTDLTGKGLPFIMRITGDRFALNPSFSGTIFCGETGKYRASLFTNQKSFDEAFVELKDILISRVVCEYPRKT